MFANPEVQVDELPSVADVRWQSLHPRYVRAQQVTRFLFALILVSAWVTIVIVRADEGPPLVPGLVAWFVLTIAMLIWPLIAVPRCGYALREHDLLYRQGVIFCKVTALPFNRIQHVEVSHGPLDRRFGLGTLKVFTAGGSGGDLSIEGLPADKATQLRDFILGKAGVAIEGD